MIAANSRMQQNPGNPGNPKMKIDENK